MHIRKLIWSDRVIDKLAQKHHVSPEEVREVCYSKHHVRKGPDDIYYVYGQTYDGRYLLVVVAHKGQGRFKVITARDMDRSEKRFYGRMKR